MPVPVPVPAARAAAARRNCGRACGRSSRPSTASTIPPSAAGRRSEPSRYRCSTGCWLAGCGLRTMVSWAPKVSDSAASEPATLTRRAPGSASVISRPCAASTVRSVSMSAGSVPCRAASSSRVTVSGPSTSSRGSAARRRVIRVISIRCAPSTGPAFSAAGNGARSLPGNGTKDSPDMLLLPSAERPSSGGTILGRVTPAPRCRRRRGVPASRIPGIPRPGVRCAVSRCPAHLGVSATSRRVVARPVCRPRRPPRRSSAPKKAPHSVTTRTNAPRPSAGLICDKH